MNSKIRALVLTARPKTLAAAIVPVVVASALARADGYHLTVWVGSFALLSAMCIQIGTNFLNDAIDFKKGADTHTRLGDARAAQSGWFSPRTVLLMGLAFLMLAFLFGIPLVVRGGVPIMAVGLFSLFLGYGYTGGPFPLAYLGLGDLFVILFFGLIAVGGVYFLQTSHYDWSAFVAGLQIGFLATVLIAINNLRDLDQDRLINKKTLSVRLGPKLGRIEVLVLLTSAYLANFYWFVTGRWLAGALPFVALPLALHVGLTIYRTQASRAYNKLLARAALLHMLFGVSLSVGLLAQ